VNDAGKLYTQNTYDIAGFPFYSAVFLLLRVGKGLQANSLKQLNVGSIGYAFALL